MNFIEAIYEAASNVDFVNNYDRITGSNFGQVINANPLSRLIDGATGFAQEEWLKFAFFFNECVWSRLPTDAFGNQD